jgi:hypothetical protein
MGPGVCFGGRLSFVKTPSPFKDAILHIIRSYHVDIRGALFKTELKTAELTTTENDMPLLVIAPVSGPKVMELIPTYWSAANNKTHIRISSQTAYNTTLMRPRRNRIIINEGSVIPADKLGDHEKACTLAYGEFQKVIRNEKTLPQKTGIQKRIDEPPLENRLPGNVNDQNRYREALRGLIKPVNSPHAIPKELNVLSDLFRGYPGLLARVEKLRTLFGQGQQDERTNSILEMLAATVHLSNAHTSEIRMFHDPSLSHTYIRNIIEDRMKKFTEKNMDNIRFILQFFLEYLPESRDPLESASRKTAEFRDLVSRFLLEHGSLDYDRSKKGGNQ